MQHDGQRRSAKGDQANDPCTTLLSELARDDRRQHKAHDGGDEGSQENRPGLNVCESPEVGKETE